MAFTTASHSSLYHGLNSLGKTLMFITVNISCNCSKLSTGAAEVECKLNNSVKLQ